MAEELKPGEGFEGGAAAGGAVGMEQPGSLVPESGVEHAVESSKERAGEKISEILTKVQGAVPAPGTPSDDAAVAVDAKSVYDETDAESRVTKLVSLAQTKGVAHAVKVAAHLNDFYVLDRMHDELADKFYEALKSGGMISE
jgi:hypothetical protein